MRKRLRKLLRRLVVWAMTDERGREWTPINQHIYTGVARWDVTAGEIFVRGASTDKGRKAVINTIKLARTNREL